MNTKVPFPMSFQDEILPPSSSLYFLLFEKDIALSPIFTDHSLNSLSSFNKHVNEFNSNIFIYSALSENLDLTTDINKQLTLLECLNSCNLTKDKSFETE